MSLLGQKSGLAGNKWRFLRHQHWLNAFEGPSRRLQPRMLTSSTLVPQRESKLLPFFYLKMKSYCLEAFFVTISKLQVEMSLAEVMRLLQTESSVWHFDVREYASVFAATHTSLTSRFYVRWRWVGNVLSYLLSCQGVACVFPVITSSWNAY
jgi:hypothetical protein